MWRRCYSESRDEEWGLLLSAAGYRQSGLIPFWLVPNTLVPSASRDTAASAREGYAVCAGACGASVPIRQKCSSCAARAVGEWLDTSDFRRASNRRRVSLSQPEMPGRYHADAYPAAGTHVTQPIIKREI
jgi:hypothetical protein